MQSIRNIGCSRQILLITPLRPIKRPSGENPECMKNNRNSHMAQNDMNKSVWALLSFPTVVAVLRQAVLRLKGKPWVASGPNFRMRLKLDETSETDDGSTENSEQLSTCIESALDADYPYSVDQCIDLDRNMPRLPGIKVGRLHCFINYFQ